MSTLDRPPRWAEALLSWLLQDEWQTPLGDFEEYYHELVEKQGARRARWWYRGQVLRLLPDRLYEKLYTATTMLKNYIKLAYRNLLKSKAASFINIFGLSVAVGCSIVVYLFLQNYLTLDDFHEHGADIYLVDHLIERSGEQQAWGTSPAPLGPALAADVPQIERVVRVNRLGGTVQRGDRFFEEGIVFADPGFFDMFTFPLQAGNPTALEDRDAVILSEDAAHKYFGEDDPLGQELIVKVGAGPGKAFTVQGVAEAFPANAGFAFDVLTHFANQSISEQAELDDWATLIRATFLQLQPGQDPEIVEAQLDRYVALHNAADEDWPIQSFFLDNLRDPAFDAFNIRNRFAEAPHIVFILMLVAIPLFMLALSCVNYVNIALGSAARRIKEIGVRKVMGSTKGQLVKQFLTENMLLCLLALVLGLGVAQAFLVPLFNSVFVMSISLSLAENLGLWFFLVGLLLFVGLASGAYPAFYIASFQPVLIFRGTQRWTGRKWFSRSFLTFQFVLAFITVIIGVYLPLNGRYIANKAWGYAPEHTLVVPLQKSQQFDILRNELLQQSYVRHVAGSAEQVGNAFGEARIDVSGTKKDVYLIDVGTAYLETVGMRLRAGRFFDARYGGDTGDAVVINDAFAQAEGWEEPVGQTIRYEGTRYTVVGVVEDFMMHPMIDARPVFFRLVDDAQYRYLSLRVADGTEEQAAASIKATWKRLFPDAPFDLYFQSEVFDVHYKSYWNLTTSFSYIALLALLISCMGLFGLASQQMARRLKDVSIRKVLGASVPQLIVLVNRGFLVLLAIAAVIATLICSVGLNALFSMVGADVLPLGMVPLGLAYMLVLLTAALSVGMHVRKLVLANPAEVLRNE